MLRVLLLATLAVAPAQVAPISVEFTSDSVYKKESIVVPKDVVQEEESELYTIILEEDKLLGYEIYDNPDTEYIDGLKFDDEFVTNWRIEHVDFSVEHKLHIKTVYTDDAAGMFVAAKDGDWSKLLANPLMLFQIFYYFLAAISIIVGGIGLFKSKKRKVKDHNEIARNVKEQASASSEAFKDEAIEIVTSIVTPVLTSSKNTTENIIKALIMSQSGDKNSTLGLIDLLKQTSDTNVEAIAENVKKEIVNKFALKEQAKAQVKKVVKEIASGTSKDDSGHDDLGGISI